MFLPFVRTTGASLTIGRHAFPSDPASLFSNLPNVGGSSRLDALVGYTELAYVAYSTPSRPSKLDLMNVSILDQPRLINQLHALLRQLFAGGAPTSLDAPAHTTCDLPS